MEEKTYYILIEHQQRWYLALQAEGQESAKEEFDRQRAVRTRVAVVRSAVLASRCADPGGLSVEEMEAHAAKVSAKIYKGTWRAYRTLWLPPVGVETPVCATAKCGYVGDSAGMVFLGERLQGFPFNYFKCSCGIMYVAGLTPLQKAAISKENDRGFRWQERDRILKIAA